MEGRDTNYDTFKSKFPKLTNYLLTPLHAKFYQYDETFKLNVEHKAIIYETDIATQLFQYMEPFIHQYNNWFKQTITHEYNDGRYIIYLKKGRCKNEQKEKHN